MVFAADNKDRSKKEGKVSMFSVCFPLGQKRQRIGPSPESSSVLPLKVDLASFFISCTPRSSCVGPFAHAVSSGIYVSMLGEGRVTASIGVSTLGAFLHLPMCVRSLGHLGELTSKAWIWMKPRIKGATGIQILKSNLRNQHSTTKCW